LVGVRELSGDGRRGSGPLRAAGAALYGHGQYDALSACLGSAILWRRVK
jgi:hypothetical protein